MEARGTPITLGGKERHLRFTLNAIADIGDRLGLKVRLDHFQEDLLAVPLPLSTIRLVLWAGLRTSDKELTEEQVGDMIDGENMPEVLRAFFSHFGVTWEGTMGLPGRADEVQASPTPSEERLTVGA